LFQFCSSFPCAHSPRSGGQQSLSARNDEFSRISGPCRRRWKSQSAKFNHEHDGIGVRIWFRISKRSQSQHFLGRTFVQQVRPVLVLGRRWWRRRSQFVDVGKTSPEWSRNLAWRLGKLIWLDTLKLGSCILISAIDSYLVDTWTHLRRSLILVAFWIFTKLLSIPSWILLWMHLIRTQFYVMPLCKLKTKAIHLFITKLNQIHTHHFSLTNHQKL